MSVGMRDRQFMVAVAQLRRCLDAQSMIEASGALPVAQSVIKDGTKAILNGCAQTKVAKRRETKMTKKAKLKKKNKLEESCLTQKTPDIGYQSAAVDTEKLAEFQFRRGLVTAMEVILRELR